MELVQNSLLSHYPNINLSILSYFGNKKEIPLLVFKDLRDDLEIERDSS